MPTLAPQHDELLQSSLPQPQAEADPARRLAVSKAVVVHAGARDAYQLALALAEAGLLEALVTDLFWSEEEHSSRTLAQRLPPSLLNRLRQRSRPGLPPGSVVTCLAAGLRGLILDRIPAIPFALRRKLVRSADATLGKVAGQRARRMAAGLVSYSYTGYDAFKAYGRPAMLFQVHPHPLTMRSILQGELDLHPDCAPSLLAEWELSLPEADFQHLVRETATASCFLAASSFTRDTLIEHGAAPSTITVVPYGVDLQRFRPSASRRRSPTARLQLLFVGRINQRKGVKYLLQALELLQGSPVDLLICGRVVDDLELFRPFAAQVRIRPSVSASELVAAYQAADLFVFPSVGEGFGQVLLEALACGLPILSTTHTAAPDLIEDRVQGFIVEPRRPQRLAERIEWALTHRDELARMGVRARERAEQFTWSRFRQASAAAVARYLATQPPFVERSAR